jgi:hypothetical protein
MRARISPPCGAVRFRCFDSGSRIDLVNSRQNGMEVRRPLCRSTKGNGTITNPHYYKRMIHQGTGKPKYTTIKKKKMVQQGLPTKTSHCTFSCPKVGTTAMVPISCNIPTFSDFTFGFSFFECIQNGQPAKAAYSSRKLTNQTLDH